MYRSILLLLLTVAAIQLPDTRKPLIVKTESGLVSGSFNAQTQVYAFKGVPYAAPPVGPLRWRAPLPAKRWSGILKCMHFGASAIQPVPLPQRPFTKEFIPPGGPMSEDCLYLNIWTRAKTKDAKLPVIVWIHGGGFTTGSGSVPIYDGGAVAQKGVIFVTINYRLGVFGFLAHPALSAESPYHVSGNYGLLDQVAALQWVKRNIAAFGGDPDRVTIDGQSAGSCSVNALVASPLAKGLFKRAIAESGFLMQPGRCPTLKQAEQEGLHTMAAKRVRTLAGMRALSAGALLKDDQMRLPVVDGYLLPDQVDRIIKAGKQNPADLLIGYNDGDDFIMQPLSANAFKTEVSKEYGNKAGELLKYYPAATDAEAEQSQRHLSRDQTFAWEAYLWAGRQVQQSKSKAWYYHFGHVPPHEPVFGAFHTAEVPYALTNLRLWNKHFSSQDRVLSDQMSAYWINFASTGDPNGNGLPRWPACAAPSKKIMEFGAKTGAAVLPAANRFALFAAARWTVVPVN